jgi:N-acylneuraminate cytidylyltransferase/CMP-N,N'-diacetyllegionaminic acid synthase
LINGKAVLAIVPARSGSKGLPMKNIRPLLGKPLLAWPIQAALASAHVDRTIVSTDDAGFAKLAIEHGAEVPFLRPAELATDQASSVDAVLDVIDRLEAAGSSFDYVVLLEPTSPLTDGHDVDNALEQLDAAGEAAESIVGIALLETQHPAFAVRKGRGQIIEPYEAKSFEHLPRRQDLEELFILDGSLYISTVAALRRERKFCHDRTLGFVGPRYKSLEVDDLVDFICIEAIATRIDEIKSSETSSHGKDL